MIIVIGDARFVVAYYHPFVVDHSPLNLGIASANVPFTIPYEHYHVTTYLRYHEIDQLESNVT